ncbi:Hypothetical predicted protein [Xyrichtys novacula]|uniref:Uncharacterized protein n=1 Tax=Xyrichtys novacula TaxID=13765 RepID=A0AAV1GTQ3_XYRNO|nr:Hypothetical predicted protein [Xyrichtys novacula]
MRAWRLTVAAALLNESSRLSFVGIKGCRRKPKTRRRFALQVVTAVGRFGKMEAVNFWGVEGGVKSLKGNQTRLFLSTPDRTPFFHLDLSVGSLVLVQSDKKEVNPSTFTPDLRSLTS